MIQHRTALSASRRRPPLSFDSLETRQMLNASPIARPLVDGSAIHDVRPAAIGTETTAHPPRAALRDLLHDLRISMNQEWAAQIATAHQAAATASTTGLQDASTLMHPDLSILAASRPGMNGAPLVSGFGSTVYSPSQIDKAYGFSSVANEGKGVTVGIVDAYGDPNIVGDVSTFSSFFGLPQMTGTGGNPSLKVVSQAGNPGPGDSGWDVETALDVEWVHSVAPLANIVLVEGNAATIGSLLGYGIPTAIANGAVIVSNSYGSTEYSGETTDNANYLVGPSQSAVIDYSTGDNGAPGSFPAYSPDVVAVGGTSLYTASARGAYGNEVGWSGSGGGTSQYFSTPSYQSSNGVNYGARSTPDVSIVADPNTGVWVYDSYSYPDELIGVGGTSLACPVFSGMVALADAARAANGYAPLVSYAGNSDSIQSKLYGDYNSGNYGNDFHDITTGNNGHPAGVGYDQVTGIGSPKVPNLVATLSSTA